MGRMGRGRMGCMDCGGRMHRLDPISNVLYTRRRNPGVRTFAPLQTIERRPTPTTDASTTTTSEGPQP